jgi:hypothetical protein
VASLVPTQGTRSCAVIIPLLQSSDCLHTHEKSSSQSARTVQHIGARPVPFGSDDASTDQSMAILHLRLTSLSRASGANVIETAAQYAAAVLVDQRSGRVYDFSAEPGVLHREIMSPGGSGSLWQDRQSLWNAANGTRKERIPGLRASTRSRCRTSSPRGSRSRSCAPSPGRSPIATTSRWTSRCIGRTGAGISGIFTPMSMRAYSSDREQ